MIIKLDSLYVLSKKDRRRILDSSLHVWSQNVQFLLNSFVTDEALDSSCIMLANYFETRNDVF